MPGGDNEDQFVEQSGSQALLAASDGVAADDAEVQLTFLHALLDDL